MTRKTVMTAEDIRRTLARIAHEIIERNRVINALVLVGIHTRGVPLAQRLADNIARFEGIVLPVGALDFSLHRDDRAVPGETPVLRRTEIPADIHDKSIVLVDDVLFTGRSIRAAMDALIELGRPRLIQLAVLIDRGHREMPIRADYVGRNIPSAHHEEIQVQLVEIDGTDAVNIISQERNALAEKEKLSGAGSLKRSYHVSGE